MKITCCATTVFIKIKRGSIPLGSTTKVIPWMFDIQGIFVLSAYSRFFHAFLCVHMVTFIIIKSQSKSHFANEIANRFAVVISSASF